MTLQFDSNTVASALTAFAPLEPTCAPAKQQQHSPSAQTAPSDSIRRLIDWNVSNPDGSDAALQELLKAIGNRLKAEIHFGSVMPNGNAGTIFSSHTEAVENDNLLSLKSGIVEACFAAVKFLFAGPEDATSAVLENYRQAEQYQTTVGISIPNLQSPSDLPSGIVIGFRNELPSDLDLTKVLTQFRLELARWVHTWQACRDYQVSNRWSRLAYSIRRYRARVIAISAGVMCLLTFVPVPYWPQRECVVEPSARSFVSSPIDGRVLRSLVRPGDVVEAGQLIGQMDEEQLRWELGSAQAELQQAGKQQDAALAHREGGKMRLAQLEQQKIALKIQGLQAQLERLELRSPVTGIVLQGEWYRSEGAPVARGDTLFEIAPLEKMTVQVRLTTEDLGEIEVGDTATVRIEAAYGEAWHGALSRIDPRAAVIDDQIRFVADMEVENRENLLRPGMKGSVRIDAGQKSIGWLIFHRPYTWLMKYLVW